eukprot:scaffold42530_cov21-Prasinocladus_malaysianus.AAC.1
MAGRHGICAGSNVNHQKLVILEAPPRNQLKMSCVAACDTVHCEGKSFLAAFSAVQLRSAPDDSDMLMLKELMAVLSPTRAPSPSFRSGQFFKSRVERLRRDLRRNKPVPVTWVSCSTKYNSLVHLLAKTAHAWSPTEVPPKSAYSRSSMSRKMTSTSLS